MYYAFCLLECDACRIMLVRMLLAACGCVGLRVINVNYDLCQVTIIYTINMVSEKAASVSSVY